MNPAKISTRTVLENIALLVICYFLNISASNVKNLPDSKLWFTRHNVPFVQSDGTVPEPSTSSPAEPWGHKSLGAKLTHQVIRVYILRDLIIFLWIQEADWDGSRSQHKTT